ncbi:hypothetical protein AALO_G00011300 [Alosa alosa]|uniref:Somatostatin/Cortistatin C-terminal domain-containing protein n=1 Tax=Alosa alosa TaxID=278164 RepID=A0AAV6HGC5_9TELE|nr:hypothetical protein AALO_G00011300 [Alosa alosa]
MHTSKILCAAIMVCLSLIVDGTSFGRSQMLSKSFGRESLPGHRNKEVSTTFSTLEMLMIIFKPDSGTRASENLVQKSEEGKRALMRREDSDMTKEESKRKFDKKGCRFVFYWKSWASCK